jgi:antitoxin component of MazEF toxin-antitoxin module
MLQACVITCYNAWMKIPIRRIGNSLGVILPKASLDAWKLGKGDFLELTARALRPPASGGLAHTALDELRRNMALAIVRRFTANEIRAQILANLHRWRGRGSWVPAFDEWHAIATSADDGSLFAAMLGRDEHATRLRQSAPYAGLLSRREVEILNEEAAG